MARKTRDAVAPAARQGAETGPVDQAKALLERGDVRRARELLEKLVASGPEADRDAARELLDRTRPDPAALLTVTAVLVLIAVAVTLGLLLRR
jgi:FimV-like protein